MRDLDADKLVGKYTLVVKLGRQKAKSYHYFIILFALVAFVVYALYSQMPLLNYAFIIAYIPF